MKTIPTYLDFLTLFILTLSAGAQGPVHDYSFREIAIPGVSNISVNALNNAGTFTGTSDSGPFVLGHDKFETISIPGATSVVPTGVNGSGDVVGSYIDEMNYPRPFLRNRDGSVVKLVWGPTGDNPGAANGINARGTVVGDSFAIDTNGFLNAGSAIISDRGEMRYLDFPAPTVAITQLRAINAHGHMVGQAILKEIFNSGGFFVYKSSGFILDGDGPRVIEMPWPWVAATGLNARGTVVGTYIGAPGRVADYHGFVLASGTMTTVDLTHTNEWPPFVMGEIPGQGERRFNLVSVGTSINGINDHDEIVAVSFATYMNRTFFTSLSYNRSFVGKRGR